VSDHAPPASPLGPRPTPEPAGSERADLDRIERELRDVETTLARLADGTDWADGTEAPDGIDGSDADPRADAPDR
jgi:hypothetical protein